MYFVKYGKEYLHDPRVDGCMLLDLSLECEENSCGYCDFTIYPNHPMYDKLQERDADNPVEVYDDDILLFAGFIYELGKEFYLDGHVKCKGELEYLNESIIRPYSTEARGYGLQCPKSIEGYFKWLIDQHNSQVKENKQFTVGINQGGILHPGNLLELTNTEYPRTIEEIRKQLIDEYKGYLCIRHENGIRYLDYISEWQDVNSQILDFGVNLTNYTQTDDSDNIATYMVPLGAKMSETEYEYDDGYFETEDSSLNASKQYYTRGENGYTQCSEDLEAFESGTTYYEYDETEDESDLSLTLEGLADGTYGDDGYKKSGDKVYHEASVNKYGWIAGSYKDTEIVTREELANSAIIALKELVSPKRTIEIKAVDMHLINPTITPIRIGEYVRVRSVPHKLDSYFLCVSIELDLNNPENSLYTLGTTFDTLTGQQNKRINTLNSTINTQYEKVAAIGGEAKKTAEEAKKTVGDSVVSVVEQYATSLDPNITPTEGWTTIVPEYTPGLFVWRKMISTRGDGTVVTGDPSCLTGASGTAGQNGEDAVLLRIDSSRGTVFKNNSISTVLSAVIYKGSQRITDITALRAAFGVGAYLEWSWQQIDENAFGIISSSDSMISNDGFNLNISADEVDTKCTFMCQLKV